MINKASRVARTAHSPSQRRRALDELVAKRELEGRTLSVRDYRDAMGDRISPRLAELDLQAHPRLLARGKTRNRVYFIRKLRSPIRRPAG